MENVYKMTGLSKYYTVIEEVISFNCPVLYKTIFKSNETLLGNIFIEWILTLGFSKIPLKFSGEFLYNLALYGWNYYFKFIGAMMKEIETISNSFLSNIKRNIKEVTLYNNFNVEHFPENIRKSLSPMKKRTGFNAFTNIFKKQKQKETNSNLTTEKTFMFINKKNGNSLGNEEIYIYFKNKFKKFDDQNWENIFNNVLAAKIKSKHIVTNLNWTLSNKFAILN